MDLWSVKMFDKDEQGRLLYFDYGYNYPLGELDLKPIDKIERRKAFYMRGPFRLLKRWFPVINYVNQMNIGSMIRKESVEQTEEGITVTWEVPESLYWLFFSSTGYSISAAYDARIFELNTNAESEDDVVEFNTDDVE